MYAATALVLNADFLRLVRDEDADLPVEVSGDRVRGSSGFEIVRSTNAAESEHDLWKLLPLPPGQIQHGNKITRIPLYL